MGTKVTTAQVVIFLVLATLTYAFQVHRIPKRRPPYLSQPDQQFSNATIFKTSRTMELRLSDRTVNLLNVPDVMQATQYTCGPSSLSAVLNYYQLVYREAELAKLAKTTQEYGTGPRNLVAAAQQLYISAELREGLRISQVEGYLSGGKPVIVEIQAWGDEGTSYIDDFDDGHYVVMIGFDSAYFYFEDPWIIGSIGYIRKSEFLERWHDYVHEESRKVYGIGIIVNHPHQSNPVVVELQ